MDFFTTAMCNPMLTTPQRYSLLFTVILMDILTGMEFDIFVPSFPEIQAHFHITPFWLEAALSSNFIGYCLSLFIVGETADRLGRKPVIITGLLLFIIGSLACLYAPVYALFLFGRFLQGIGIAAPSILSFLLIADVYALKEQQVWMSLLNAFMNMAGAFAPVIGSYITLYFHWHGNFITLLSLAVLVLFCTLRVIPRHLGTPVQPHEKRIRYRTLLTQKPLMLLIIALFINFTPYWIFVGISPLLYIKDLGVSLHHFGYYQGILAFSFSIGSLFFGILIKKTVIPYKKFLWIANSIFMLSVVVMGLVVLFYPTHPLWITLSMLIFVIGQIPTNLLGPICLNYIPSAKARIGAILQGGRLIFSSLSLQIAGYFYEHTFASAGLMIMLFISMTIIAFSIILTHRSLDSAFQS